MGEELGVERRRSTKNDGFDPESPASTLSVSSSSLASVTSPSKRMSRRLTLGGTVVADGTLPLRVFAEAPLTRAQVDLLYTRAAKSAAPAGALPGRAQGGNITVDAF